MRRFLVLAALCACGRLGFDRVPGQGSAIDAPRNPIDVGVPVEQCPAQPMTAGTMVTTPLELVNAINAAAPGDTILLADGVYDFNTTINIATAGLTIRSASNRADAVKIDGGSAAAPIFYVRASNTTFISLSIVNSADEGIRVEPLMTGTAAGTQIYDVTFEDNNGVALRAKPYSTLATGPFSDNGSVACSRFLHSTPDSCAGDGTFGVRLMGTRTWTVRDNYFAGQCSPTRVRAIWSDYGARDVDIIDNVFSNNMNNIIFGNMALRTYPDPLPTGCTGTPQAWGGVICNNRIAGLGVASNSSAPDFDEGIALWSTCDTWVMHNTIVSPAGAETFENLEYRYPETYVHLVNNVASVAPLGRDSATIDPASSTVTYSMASDFVDALAGDLHLSPTFSVAPGSPISKCLTDAAGVMRNAAGPTPGAYER